MKSLTFSLILATAILAVVIAAPEPEPAKAPRFRAAQIIQDDTNDEGIAVVDDKEASEVTDGANKKGDASSGRLFMKKFLLFKNMFGSNQQQPVIPIIVTGAGGGTTTTTGGVTTGTTPTTTTITETGTIPTATGTITTSPITGRITEKKPAQRVQLGGRGSYDNKNEEEQEEMDEEEEEAAMVDNQALAAALAAGAEEYVVTDQEIGGTTNAENGAARVNLRRSGAQRGKIVSVRVPAKYRGYFKNGQRVILNNGKRAGAKRRVVKKRVIKKRGRKNKNKRRRGKGKH
ncbi:uncharacterized protein LOC142230634 [Haematobia irritans]|uniref:uncharacterized protein LOC142230634 n=1 Tax=Haematobia irritans TaxID=7368 RepID=UPI003F4FFBEA